VARAIGGHLSNLPFGITTAAPQVLKGQHFGTHRLVNSGTQDGTWPRTISFLTM
jgi:hypothetical protein